jgi:hypothetical protein
MVETMPDKIRNNFIYRVCYNKIWRKMQNVTFKVVTKDNINSVINEWKKIYGEDFTFLIMHAKDYEASVSNFEELRRYIAQQREIIVYYRKVIP